MADYIAVDLGAESGRVMLVTLANDNISIKEIHRFANTTVREGNTLRWNIHEQFAQIKHGIAEAVKQGGDIKSIGVDTWGVDFGLIDESGKLIEKPFHYRDERNLGMIEKASEILPKKDIYENTGIQFMPFNTLFQLMAYQQFSPDILSKASKLLFMPNLFSYMLTGEIAAEYTMASTSQLVDMKTGQWSDTIINAFRLPKDILPGIVHPGTPTGMLKKALADEMGCQPIPVIAVGCHDTASAVAAVPVVGEKSWAYLSSGTWSLMGVELDRPVINKDTFELQFTNEGGVYNTIRLLKNIMGLWPLQQCRQAWLKQGNELSYAQIAKMAENAKPFTAYIDVDHDDFLTMGNMPAKINNYLKFSGQNQIEDIGQMARVIIESLAVKYSQVLEKIETIIDAPIESLYIVGGGSQNQLLNQFAADATGIEVVAGPVEATVLGNILVQAIADKQITNLSQGRKLVTKSFEVSRYKPQNIEKWNEFKDTCTKIAN